MNGRTVTENDFRAPEFKDAKVEDYEFRTDGKLVRKDRWETAFRSIAFAVYQSGRVEFEIEQVLKRARYLIELGHEAEYDEDLFDDEDDDEDDDDEDDE